MKEDELLKALSEQIREGIKTQSNMDAQDIPVDNKGVAAQSTSSGWTWDSLPDDIKERFPHPPDRSNFSSTEEFEEARGFWFSRYGRVIGMALQQRK